MSARLGIDVEGRGKKSSMLGELGRVGRVEARDVLDGKLGFSMQSCCVGVRSWKGKGILAGIGRLLRCCMRLIHYFCRVVVR